MNDQRLAQKTIAITASRRAEEQAAAFERHGACVVLTPTVRIVKTDDDAALAHETANVLANPPHLLLVSTGHGLKSWLESTEKTGVGAQLKEVLSHAEIYVRGAKGRGAVRSLGLEDSGIAEIETTESLVELALHRGVAGKNVTIQQHGQPDPALVQRLEKAGAKVTEVHPNRWVQPERPELVDELIKNLIAGDIDAITFTAAPAVESLLNRAKSMGMYKELVGALASKVVIAVVGPVTAEPLQALQIKTIYPERFRMGAMVKLLTETLV